jgi:PD-(D/E)XK nuclease superfamily
MLLAVSNSPQRRGGRGEGMRELTEKIIGAAIEVHTALGPGLLESTYEAFSELQRPCSEKRHQARCSQLQGFLGALCASPMKPSWRRTSGRRSEFPEFRRFSGPRREFPRAAKSHSITNGTTWHPYDLHISHCLTAIFRPPRFGARNSAARTRTLRRSGPPEGGGEIHAGRAIFFRVGGRSPPGRHEPTARPGTASAA